MLTRSRGPAALLYLAIALLVPVADHAFAQDLPEYRDDRSNPAALVESLYNAIDRGEYLRAWSYFDPTATGSFDEFEAGYRDTSRVSVRVGAVTGEGAAGSLYGSVPVAVEAVATDGSRSVFVGCYETRLVQPGAQIEPPFAPIRIVAGRLEETQTGFADAVGVCPEEGL